MSPFTPRRFCTSDPTGGSIGPLPAHFFVEELPAYLPCGEGEHLFLFVEKRGQNTSDVAKRLALHAKKPQRDIGFAGMKDKHAVTRQWFSVAYAGDDASTWDLGDECQILELGRHKNKLRTGHLIGNRFRITLIGVEPDGAARARTIAVELLSRGFPNYFGPQRFGSNGRNLAQARAWANSLADSSRTSAAEDPERTERSARRRRGSRRGRDNYRFDNKLLSSVLQSEVFNRYVAARLETADQLLRGEVVRLSGAGAHFVVDDPERELHRYLSGDIVLTGPMFGPKGLQSRDEARELEARVFRDVGLDEKTLEHIGRHAPGTRRDLMLRPTELNAEAAAPDELVLTFSLPAGAYATGLVREFTDGAWDAPRAASGDSRVASPGAPHP